MKKRFINSILLTVLVVGVGYARPPKDADKEIPSLIETYRHNDTRPFGGYAAYQLLQAMYPKQVIAPEKETMEDAWRNGYDTDALYITIGESFFSSEEDVTAIKNYVRAGNDMLIAASEFDENLLEEVGCSVVSASLFQYILHVPMMQTSVKLDTARFNDSLSYGFYYRPFANYFTGLSKDESIVLGYNDAGRPNFVVFLLGKGKLFLHCEPRTFSNYFLLQKNNYRYLAQLMAYMKESPDKIVWNNYYNNIHRSRSRDNDKSGSLFDGLKGGLLAAFWLLLVLIVIYIIDGTKRRQRVIPIRKPNENTTVTFAETVGLLYLQKKDNKNIAEKMITYFNEFVRNQYFLNTNQANRDFITTLSRKSGVAQDKVEALYSTMANAQRSNIIDDYQLLSLNQQIQNFYKYRN